MNIHLPTILLILTTIFFQTFTLFSNSTISNFTITGLSNPSKITLDSTGTKFIVWNPNAEIRIYDLNGTLICFNTLPKQIQRIDWSTTSLPMLLPYPGKEFSTINDTTCQIVKTWYMKDLIDTSKNDAFCELVFSFKNDGPFVTVSARAAVAGLDLLSGSPTSTYFPMDSSLPQPQTFVYSHDLKFLYIVLADSLTGMRNVQVYPTNSLTPKKGEEIFFNTSLGALAASSDNKTIIGVGNSMSNDSTYVYRFDKNGNIMIKATRSRIDKAISIGQGNVAVLFKCQEGSMEVIRTGDGQSVQNTTYTTSSYFYDADYKNKVLLILDSLGRVITYSYEFDEDVQPIPDPVDPGNSLPFWVIVAGVAGAVLLLVVVLMCVFRKKLPLGVRKVFCKCFEKEKPEEKESLINDREEAHERESVKEDDEKSVKSEGKRSSFVHVPDEPKQKPPAYIPPLAPAANSHLNDGPVERSSSNLRLQKQQKEEQQRRQEEERKRLEEVRKIEYQRYMNEKNNFVDQRQNLLKGKNSQTKDEHEGEHFNKDFFVVKRKPQSENQKEDEKRYDDENDQFNR